MRTDLIACLAGGCLIALPTAGITQEVPFDVAEVFFELNNTDGDLGIHALIDGGPWERVQIEDPLDRGMLNIFVRSRLRRQGMTELFFESAEPTFDELPPEVFFQRFPEGLYSVEGISQDGEELESDAMVLHAMPAPPAPLINGLPMATQCDDELPGYDAPVITPPVVITWPAVTHTHPTLGFPQDAPGLEIYNYEVVLETDLEDADGEEFTTVFSTIVPGAIREMTVPEQFLAQSDVFKYEVLAREISFNQTAVESCFELAGD